MKVKVINTGAILGAPVGGISSFPVSGAYFGVFAISPLGTPSYVESKDLIVSGAKESWGDRNCRHFKLTGNLSVLPSVSVSRQVVELPTGDGWTPATTTQILYSYSMNDGTVWKMVGPEAIGSLSNYRQDFPDMASSDGYKRKEIYLEVVTSGNIFTRTVHYVTVRPNGTEVPYTSSKTYEVNFDSHNYRDAGSPYWFGFSSLKTASFSVSSVRFPQQWIEYERLMSQLGRDFLPISENMILGDLVRRCANDAQVVQTNSIELVRDIRELSSTLEEVYALTRGKVNAKKIAQSYLSYKYGARLTFKDLQLIAKTAKEQLEKQHLAYSKVHASNVVSTLPIKGTGIGSRTSKYTYTIHYRPYSQDWRRGIQLAQDSGLFPSLQNSWDLVPLSFVADWFTQLGDRISMFDADTYWSTYDILGCCSSVKQTFSDVTKLFSTTLWTLVGSCDLHYYSRAPHLSVLPASYFENSPREFRNYAEALALIVANSRH